MAEHNQVVLAGLPFLGILLGRTKSGCWELIDTIFQCIPGRIQGLMFENFNSSGLSTWYLFTIFNFSSNVDQMQELSYSFRLCQNVLIMCEYTSYEICIYDMFVHELLIEFKGGFSSAI